MPEAEAREVTEKLRHLSARPMYSGDQWHKWQGEWCANAANVIERLTDESGKLREEVARLEKLVYVPGLWRCPKCDFQLIQGNLNAHDGSISARDTPGDKCPNCESPLWRVTERDAGNDMVDRCETAVIEARTLREALTELLDQTTSHMVGEGWHSTEIEQRPYIIQARAALSSTGGDDAGR